MLTWCNMPPPMKPHPPSRCPRTDLREVRPTFGFGSAIGDETSLFSTSQQNNLWRRFIHFSFCLHKTNSGITVRKCHYSICARVHKTDLDTQSRHFTIRSVSTKRKSNYTNIHGQKIILSSLSTDREMPIRGISIKSKLSWMEKTKKNA